MRFQPCHPCPRIAIGAFRRGIWASVGLHLLLLGLSGSVRAQSRGAPNNPAVQELYTAAKAAEAQGNLAGAIAKYESLIQIAPRLGSAYNNLGALYLREREYKKAAAVLQTGLKIEPKMSSASALLGISLYEMGEYEGARRNLDIALRANPGDGNAELFLANALIKLDQLELATVHLNRLSARDANNQEIWYLLGKLHMKLSEQALSKLNQIDPNSVWAHEISGEVMESMKNFDGALTEYKKAVEVAPEQPGTHYLLGNAYWSLASWDAAYEQFQVELTHDPNNCMARWKLGNILLEQHVKAEQALSDTEEALTICPNLVQARVDRARALIRLDRNEEALGDLQTAEKGSPEEPSIHFLLSQALRALGRGKDAQAEMELFTKLEENERAATAERARQVIQDKESSPPQD